VVLAAVVARARRGVLVGMFFLTFKTPWARRVASHCFKILFVASRELWFHYDLMLSQTNFTCIRILTDQVQRTDAQAGRFQETQEGGEEDWTFVR
jgi:hypothetical protein